MAIAWTWLQDYYIWFNDHMKGVITLVTIATVTIFGGTHIHKMCQCNQMLKWGNLPQISWLRLMENQMKTRRENQKKTKWKLVKWFENLSHIKLVICFRFIDVWVRSQAPQPINERHNRTYPRTNPQNGNTNTFFDHQFVVCCRPSVYDKLPFSKLKIKRSDEFKW